MTSTTKAVGVLMVALLTTASRGGAEPLVVQMLQDIVLTSDWDHVTMLYFPHNGMLQELQYGTALCIVFFCSILYNSEIFQTR